MGNSSGEARILSSGPSPRGWHRLQQAAECLQKYAWHFESPQGAPVGLKGRPALAKGSLIHLCLAQHYMRMRARQQGTPESEWCEPEEAVELVAQVEGVPEWIPVVLRTFRAYQDRYYDDEQKYKIVDVENLVSTKIRGRYLLTGRLDLAIEDLAGRLYVWDHKSTSRLTAKHKEYYAVHGQLLGYRHMAQEKYGEKFSGLWLNLIQLVQNDGDPARFERIPLPRSESMEQQFEQSIVDIEESIERLQAEGRPFDQWPRVMSETSCIGRYGECPFIHQCRHGYGARTAGNWTWETL